MIDKYRTHTETQSLFGNPNIQKKKKKKKPLRDILPNILKTPFKAISDTKHIIILLGRS